MPDYRRVYDGNVWFFTVVTGRRQGFLTTAYARSCLRAAVEECRRRYPFEIDGWALLPDHLHCLWTLPDEDLDYSRRWSLIKRRFTQRFRDTGGAREPFWQRRFWAHRVDSEEDFKAHRDYIHYKPVKHGLVASPRQWPWSTFLRHARAGRYPVDWGAGVSFGNGVGNE